MPIPKNTTKTTQPKTPAPTNIFCFDDNVDDDGLGESGSATERWLPFEVGKWVVFAVGVNVVDSEIKIILVSGAKNMGSRKSETTLEQPSAMRSSESTFNPLQAGCTTLQGRVFRLKIAFCISI